MDIQQRIVELGYSPGHPWYYKLGARVLYPREIRDTVMISGYPGYRREEIEQADAKAEP